MWWFDLTTIFAILVTFLVVLSVSVYLYLWFPLYIYRNYPVLPGPTPRLLFGTLAEDAQKGPTKVDVERTKKFGKVYLTWTGRTPVINIGDPDVIKEIMAGDFKNFMNKPSMSNIQKIHAESLIHMNDERWKYTRALITPAFSSGKMRQVENLIKLRLERMVSQFEKAADNREPVEIGKILSAFALEVILAFGFGVDVDSLDNPDDPFLENAGTIFKELANVPLGVRLYFLFPVIRPLFRLLGLGVLMFDKSGFFDRALKALVAERRAEKQQNKRLDFIQLLLKTRSDNIGKSEDAPDVDKAFLSKMMQQRDGKGLTDEEIISNALTLLIAGNDTTSTALTYICHCLATHPDVQERLVEEIISELKEKDPNYDNVQRLQYMDMCVCEGLRLYPSVTRIVRSTREDRIVKGYHFPKGSSLQLLPYATHHNPDIWPDPEKFDPERFSPENKPNIHPYSYFPFSGGPKSCIGKRFAEMEMKMALCVLLKKFRLVAVSKDPLNVKGTMTVLGKVPVHLKIERR